jgi:hypothetical protein
MSIPTKNPMQPGRQGAQNQIFKFGNDVEDRFTPSQPIAEWDVVGAQFFDQTRERDEFYQAKVNFAQALPNNIQMVMTDDDVRWAMQKSKLEEEYNYEKFVGEMVPGVDPLSNMVRNTLHPEFQQKRQAQLQMNVELQQMIAGLVMIGPTNPAEMRLLYAIRTRQIEVPDGPIWNPYPFKTMESRKNAALRKGRWNPLMPSGSTGEIEGDNIFEHFHTTGTHTGGMPNNYGESRNPAYFRMGAGQLGPGAFVPNIPIRGPGERDWSPLQGNAANL